MSTLSPETRARVATAAAASVPAAAPEPRPLRRRRVWAGALVAVVLLGVGLAGVVWMLGVFEPLQDPVWPQGKDVGFPTFGDRIRCLEGVAAALDIDLHRVWPP